jgi:hypothetical protein
MAAARLDTVILLTNKAEELYAKGHYERCLQKWRAALTAAEALGPEDSVILAFLKTKAARASLHNEALQCALMPTHASFLETFAQYAASAAILRRRRDAGSLLEGKCRPDEVRWQLETLRAEALLVAAERNVPAASCAELMPKAALVGYDVFLYVVCSSAQLVCNAWNASLLEPGGEAEQTWLSFMCDLCDEAVALMMLPREMNANRIYAEFDVCVRLQHLEAVMPTGSVQRLWHIRLKVALARLHQSGVLEERGIGSESDVRDTAMILQRVECSVQERVDAAASGQLRSCELASCGATEAHLRHFNKCSACKTVAYYCRDHQLADWPAHKATCKAARKAAAAAKDAA